jgi:AraC-like DNA-binding protein
MGYEVLHSLRGMSSRLSMMTTGFVTHNFDCFQNTDIEFPHQCPFCEIYFMLSGSTSAIVDGLEIALQEGDLLYVGSGVSHHCVFNPKNEYCYLILSFELTGDGEKKMRLDVLKEIMKDEQYLIQNMLKRRFLHAKDSCGCRAEIDSICACITKKYMGSMIKLHNYVLNFFISALQSFSNYRRRPDVEQVINIGILNKAERIAAYIADHCCEALTVEQVSNALHFSPRHIQRIVSDYYHIRFLDMLNYCRIGRAKQFLCNSEYSIEYISCRCGYGSAQILCKHFKQNEGISPSAYRKKMKCEEPPDAAEKQAPTTPC